MKINNNNNKIIKFIFLTNNKINNKSKLIKKVRKMIIKM